MIIEKLIPGIVFIGIGLLFVFNNEQIAKGTFKLYKKFYTENNLKIMFRVCGIIFFLLGLFLMFLNNSF